MKALRIYAGPAARRHIEQHGLRARDVGIVPAAAGGPKGLILGPLDRFVFGQWLPTSQQPVHLVGASIGAWRMATACLDDSVRAFERLEADYISQDYELPPGRRTPTAEHVSERFGESLQSFYGGRVHEVLAHPRYRLHIVTSRGRHMLGREHKVGTPLGYLGAFLSNTLHRKAMGAWLERVVFSNSADMLPFGTTDYRTRRVTLTDANFRHALQASCSIPFVLKAVHDIPGAPPGAYWDGGITDYHLHLDYRVPSEAPIVLYPHFQKAVVPGWLDKGLKWRHRASAFLDSTIVLAPDPQWVARLPNRKLPDRTDFARYGTDLRARMAAWTAAVSASRELADEFAQWLAQPDPGLVHAL
ncbi:MAG TPA: patatin-like phospholipase family protein [Ramlibacter sp.]|uniref:patatin-like phospholipase family protein n=1 Tax=Ramlibacter sp. TaxID=1917967 RepID=UPI002CD5C0EB|nr:patatin-like phospholipase family protein [Ramlibacter sp.]HVZ43615.1 patatin-like phospholipase family protein [Ramlibacter sp.]